MPAFLDTLRRWLGLAPAPPEPAPVADATRDAPPRFEPAPDVDHVARHPVDREALPTADADVRERLQRHLAAALDPSRTAESPPALARLAAFGRVVAGHAALQGDEDEVRRALRVALDAAVLTGAMARLDGGAADLPLGDPGQLHRFDLSVEAALPAEVFIDAFCIASVLRDPVAQIRLCLAPPAPATLPRRRPIMRPLAEALRAVTLCDDEEAARGHLAEARRAAEALLASPTPVADRAEAAAHAGDLAMTHNVLVPSLSMLDALLAWDPAAFEDALRDSQLGHRAQHGWALHRRQGPGLLSLPGAAVTAMALDRGWRPRLRSDYLPEGLLEGGGEPAPLSCCPSCLTPLLEGTRRCAGCTGEAPREAWIELGDVAGWRALERRPCGACGEPRITAAAACAACGDGRAA